MSRVSESVAKCPPLLRRWRRALRAPSAASHTDAPGNAHRVRRPRPVAAPAGHLDSAISEVHAARVAMRNALLALDQAIGDGERFDEAFRRLVDTEINGTREEAAILSAMLATADQAGPAAAA
ncbi:hypothetical protein SAMN05421812_120121 [Asanoa hainanensis]|uniref:Uncharacterized protein n=1 Tax=Asanoa hainanensis TaxID=560556 RepID=A0A239PE55_9ACTN|nr:hypothetical protein [Asanoa hainanensis]SNT65195.1 hypothetical protein SAMN05421812_120121 [Asanoa hainanensis]